MSRSVGSLVFGTGSASCQVPCKAASYSISGQAMCNRNRRRNLRQSLVIRSSMYVLLIMQTLLFHIFLFPFCILFFTGHNNEA